jgi:glycosyltransferase involved in cell wall biosynthesis
LEIGIDVSPLQDGHRFRGIGAYTRGLLHGLSSVQSTDTYKLYFWEDLPLDRSALSVPDSAVWQAVPRPKLGRASALIAQQLLFPLRTVGRWPDVYHQLGIVANPSAGGPPLAMSRRLVVTIHDFAPLAHKQLFLANNKGRTWVYWAMLRAARQAVVVVDSETVKQDAIRILGLPQDRIVVAPLAVPPDLATALKSASKKDLPSEVGPRYLLAVMGDDPNKNLDGLLETYGYLQRTGDSPDLVIVGRVRADLAEVASKRHVAVNHLHALEGVAPAVLAALYRFALAVVVPSRHEGFGLPLLEAMHAGTPCICTDIPSLREVARGAALHVPVGDWSALADAAASVLASANVSSRLVALGLERAKAFSWERTAAQTCLAYSLALSRTIRNAT